jgi:hypothetical protein
MHSSDQDPRVVRVAYAGVPSSDTAGERDMALGDKDREVLTRMRG